MQSQKNFLLRNRLSNIKKLVFLVAVLCSFFTKGQKIGNYVNNGSFEDYWIEGFIYPMPNHWRATDSAKAFAELLIPPKVPSNGYAFQMPKDGKNYLATVFYCPTCGNQRGYPLNRLKENLLPGKKYCISFFVNLTDNSTYGIDAIGGYISDGYVDTIKKCNSPITYLIPQIENPQNSVIVDTMNWTPITGTFVANGSEKYMLIGNFRSNLSLNTTSVNPANLPTKFANYLIDAVSIIEIDLPAYAGPDISIAPGHSVYIGRELDFAIDPGCVWFKLPEMTPIDTASGMWVEPTVTTTYVVRQILDCSSEKWDTVVVHMDLVGLEKLKFLREQIQIYPVPARDYIELSSPDRTLLRDIKTAEVYNNLGQKLREEPFTDERFRITIEDLPPGSYSLNIKDHSGATFSKRFVVSP